MREIMYVIIETKEIGFLPTLYCRERRATRGNGRRRRCKLFSKITIVYGKLLRKALV